MTCKYTKPITKKLLLQSLLDIHKILEHVESEIHVVDSQIDQLEDDINSRDVDGKFD